jgi:site-specific DNA recombinase
MAIAAIYARVSLDKQREESTIASQTAALIEFSRSRGYQVPAEWVFEDEGYSGASLVRPGLERLRDLAAEGQIEAVLVHAPDRLSRKYAYQVLLIEEFARHGVQTVFIKALIALPVDMVPTPWLRGSWRLARRFVPTPPGPGASRGSSVDSW